MDPGIFMSVNTTRISFRASKIAIASSSFDASIVSKPALGALIPRRFTFESRHAPF
jgi:hypothetical protein